MSQAMTFTGERGRPLQPNSPGWLRLLQLSTLFIVQVAVMDPASAAPTRSNETELGQCIATGAGGRPWLERTLWGLRDQEGGWVGAEVRNSNGSHDLGPLQVNSWWVPQLAGMLRRPESHVRWWLTHDACFNVSAARWIFLSGLAATHDYWKAIGVYHSPTDWRQRRYTLGVAAKLKRRFGKTVFAQAADNRSEP